MAHVSVLILLLIPVDPEYGSSKHFLVNSKMDPDDAFHRCPESEDMDMDMQNEQNANMDDPTGAQRDSIDTSCVVAGTTKCDKMDGKQYLGMEFQTHKEAYDFYNAYALRTGFGIRKTSSTYSRKEGTEK